LGFNITLRQWRVADASFQYRLCYTAPSKTSRLRDCVVPHFMNACTSGVPTGKDEIRG